MAKIKEQLQQEKPITFRVTNRLGFLIQKKAANAGLNRSNYLRQQALNGKVKPKWTEEERQMVLRVIRAGNDFSLSSKQPHNRGSLLEMTLLFAKFKETLDDVIHTLRNSP